MHRPSIQAEDVLHHFLGISRALAGQLDFQSMIEAISREVHFILPHDHLDVSLLLLDGQHLHAFETGLHTSWGDFSEGLMPTAQSPIRAVLLGEVGYLLSGDAMRDPRFQFPEAFNHPIFNAQLRSRLHVPLRARGEILGALSCSKHAAHFYTLDDVRHTQHIADLLASYLYALRQTEQATKLAVAEERLRAREEGLRLGASRLTDTLENERQRIGMDLHDQTLADLTRLHRRLARLSRQGTLCGSDLQPVCDGLQQSMQELRGIIDAVKPTVLQLFGLEEGLEDLLLRSVQSSGLRIRTRLKDHTGGAANRLAEAQQIALLRIIQEAVNNAIKHAAPRAIRIDIQQRQQHLTFCVTDDGIGLGDASQRETGGIGNMRIRAQLLGARLELGAGPGGRGTRVSVSLPHNESQPITALEGP
ncbi:GAF domain-containing sensor histidine kinase [Pseudomonas typographi]|uniref:GAF domain-containing sensor histidine kinase n=1 Tax=Pseudomonas typographi TaxID=2715964 RepID=UPI0030841EC7